MKAMDRISEAGVAALAARGITDEVAERLGVVSAISDRGDDRRTWLAFPHTFGGGTHWQFRTLTGDKQFKTSTETTGYRTFFNEAVLRDRALGKQPAVITEGQLDCLALAQAGYQRAVSVPDGAPAKMTDGDGAKTKYAYLEHYRSAFEDMDSVVIWADDDPAGRALMADLTARIGASRCKFVVPTRGCKDANDVLLRHGPEAVLAMIAEARWCQVTGYYSSLAEIPELPEEAASAPGIAGLDRLWRPRRGDLTVLVGTPGAGKTTLINQIAVSLAETHGWVTVFASFEVYPNPMHRNQLRRVHLRRTPESPDDAARADKWIDDHVSWIVPGRDEPADFEWIMERLKAGVLRDNASLLVIDPWNQINHMSRPKDMNMTEYAGVCLRRLAKFASDYRAHMLLAVHPAKMMRDKDGKRPMPTGYDAADSAHFVNRPDAGLTIYRKSREATKIGCWKCRYEGIIGGLGTASFRYDENAARFQFSPQEGDDL